MSRRVVLAITIALIAAMAIVAALRFFHTHERKEVEVDLGLDPQLHLNPMLTLEHFLERLGVAVDSQPDPHNPEGIAQADVIFLDPELAVYDAWSKHLGAQWIEEGGHLIIVDPDELVGRAEAYVESLELDTVSVGPDNSASERQAGDPWTVPDDALDEAVSVEYPLPRFAEAYIQYQDDIWVPSTVDFVVITPDLGLPVATSGPWGEGRLTVINARYFLENEGLKSEGMVQVVVDLMALEDRWPDEAVIFMRHHSRPWLREVGQVGWPFFVGLLVLFVFGLTRARRFGPPIPEPDRRRQRRKEHIRATGYFLWSHRGNELMVTAARRAVVDAVAKRRPSIKSIKNDQRQTIMAEELGVSKERLQALLEGPIPRRAGDYQSLIANLEQLRRSL